MLFPLLVAIPLLGVVFVFGLVLCVFLFLFGFFCFWLCLFVKMLVKSESNQTSERTAAKPTLIAAKSKYNNCFIANITECGVISRQLQLTQASVQHYPTEQDLNTADTSCLSRTSAEHFDDRPGVCLENERSHPCANVAEPATMVNRPHRMLTATHAFVDR